MKSIFANLFILLGFATSLFFPEFSDDKSKEPILQLKANQPTEKVYFGDIISSFVDSEMTIGHQSHYSHRSHSSHSSHSSHRSHYSHYSGYNL
jgi:hypothetical protein